MAVLGEERRDPLDRAPLLVGELRVAVDATRERHEVAAEAIQVAHGSRGPCPRGPPPFSDSRSARSVATRTAAAPIASAVMSALRCARSVTQASRIASEWPAIGVVVTGKRTQSVGT